MLRADAVKEFEDFQSGKGQLSDEAIEVAIKCLKDKKARYWKRRYLKQRDLVNQAIEMFERVDKPASAKMLRIMILGGDDYVDSDSQTETQDSE